MTYATLPALNQPDEPLRLWVDSWDLRPGQRAVFDDRRQFRVVVGDRRWGKTTLGCFELLRGASEKVGHYAYFAPSFHMARDIGWETMLSIVPGNLIAISTKAPATKATADTLSLPLVNGSVIHFVSTQSTKTKEQFLEGIVFDDYEMYSENFWSSLIVPSLSHLRGWALFLASDFGIE